ncbi:MAG: putative methyltransferase [Candidatus Berkelbacteria bacterium Licking1014_7]|uniref:Putative methyltransferase n=1 Tax=Candidatus Berkelbacteria bacterium Licking1014_7 TaxID=2017147 RepID=A0A554LJ57_9BACT|nr:MAG: putative methyltransferase [Candidatus Berkelbacteria bacterium Licking1014_7]
MSDILSQHRKIWNTKKILRVIYTRWYNKIINDLNKDGRLTVEIGAGGGNFKDFYPQAIASDIDDHPWLDMVFDAHSMPFENDSVSNLVTIDTLHHLQNPIKFLQESFRILKKGGRVIMVEPFPSPFSLLVYRRFHKEPFLMDADYYKTLHSKEKYPWESNQAIPYLIFFKDKYKWEKLMGKKFKIVKKEKMSFLLYPLSGGFEHKSLILYIFIPVFQLIECCLYPLKSLMAFRCYIVLEKC